jgi:DNA-binding YbaB/EbfC family protein
MQPDLNQMMRQAAKMQKEMEKMQEELNTTPVEGSAGGGAVKVTCTGAMDFTAIKLSPEAVDPSDIETLEDLILTAIKDASNKAKELAQTKMGKSLGGLKLPPGLGF